MAASKKESTRVVSYTKLMKHVKNREYDRALTIANRILHENPQDETAFRTKIACMICQNKYQEAIPLMNDNPKLCGKLQYELAFCYYRLQEMDASKKILGQWKDNSLKKLEFMYQVSYRQDNFSEAYELLQQVMKNSGDDMDSELESNLSAVEAAMKLENCAQKTQNVTESSYEARYNSATGMFPKLNCKRRSSSILNQALFHLYTMNDVACMACCKELEPYKKYAEDVLMIKAVVISRTGEEEKAKKGLDDHLKENPDLALKICLGLVQMALKDGNKDDAISLLYDLGTNYYRPGVISALVTLLKSQGKIVEAGKVLKDAVEYYRKNDDPKNKKNLALLWRQTANFMIEQGDLAEAARSVEELHKSSPNDTVTLAQLIVAYFQHDMVKAEKISRALASLNPPDVEIAILESPNWLANVKKMKKRRKAESVPPSPAKSKSLPSTSDGKETSKSTSKKNRSKNKVPLNFETERNPDPDRWLPKFQRSTCRSKKQRKGGKVDVGKGTQGADTAASAACDMSGKIGQQKEETTPVQAQASWRSKDSHKKKKTKNSKKK